MDDSPDIHIYKVCCRNCGNIQSSVENIACSKCFSPDIVAWTKQTLPDGRTMSSIRSIDNISVKV